MTSERIKDKCPHCEDGIIQDTTKVINGIYPLRECSHCNAFEICPVEGEESPLVLIRRKLHEQGIELGMVD